MGNLLIGLKVTAIGFSTVLTVLVLLMFIITVFGKVASGLEKKPEAAPQAAAPAPQAAAAAAPKQDDGELVAVIAAAIAASGGSTKAVRAISIAHGGNSASWAVASRADAMASRL